MIICKFEKFESIAKMLCMLRTKYRRQTKWFLTIFRIFQSPEFPKFSMFSLKIWELSRPLPSKIPIVCPEYVS